MLKRKLLNVLRCQFQKRYAKRDYTSSVKYGQYNIKHMRNVGIMAHIDAGKTTTTERILYYAGVIKTMGEVHHGNTVTDYMQQERERGITITSAAVSFEWKKHCINLIDTPGHIDFTAEIEQTLHVMDGVIIILDGSAGVEAQTLTVCRQADKHNLPRIFFINKMDKSNTDLDKNLKSIIDKLNIEVLPTQFPIKENGTLKGIVDVVSLEKLIYNTHNKETTLDKFALTESTDGKLWEIANERRRALTDKLSELDDTLAGIVIQEESLDNIKPQSLVDSLYRVTTSRKGVPVLLGSAYKQIGIQPLMDSILLYLPSSDLNRYSKIYNTCNEKFCARVFKIVHDNLRGSLAIMRVYSGTFKKGQRLYNIRAKKHETVSRLYTLLANDYSEVAEISSGHIGAATLRNCNPGDLLTQSSSPHATMSAALKAEGMSEEDIKNFFVPCTNLESVFFCSIEPPSSMLQPVLENALHQLQKEDSSLTVTQNVDTGQLVLGGMGELHLNIIKDRIKKEHNIDAELGPLQIAYKETVQNEVRDMCVSEHKIGNKDQKVTIEMSVMPNQQRGNVVSVDSSPDACVKIVTARTLKFIKSGVDSALLYGPKLSCPMVNVAVMLHRLEMKPDTSRTVVEAATSKCIRMLLQKSGVCLLEPIMKLMIVTQEEYASSVIADLGKRRTEIHMIDIHGQEKIIQCFTPLSELLDYSTTLRTMTSGHATFSMHFDHYQQMDPVTEAEAIKRVNGF